MITSYVLSAATVNCFKDRLDNLWNRAEIHGTRNRSEAVISNF